jgi:hypothetical protein
MGTCNHLLEKLQKMPMHVAPSLLRKKKGESAQQPIWPNKMTCKPGSMIGNTGAHKKFDIRGATRLDNC